MDNNVELIKQYKELLEAGIISEEEYKQRRDEIISTIKESGSEQTNSAQTKKEGNAQRQSTVQGAVLSDKSIDQQSKNLIITAVVLEIIAIVLMFMPKVFLQEKWGSYGSYASNPYARLLQSRWEVNFFQGLPSIIGALILLLVVAAIVLQLLPLLKSNSNFASDKSPVFEYGGLLIALPTLLTLLFSIAGRNKDDYGYCIDFNWMFYIIFIMLVVATALSGIKVYKLKKK